MKHGIAPETDVALATVTETMDCTASALGPAVVNAANNAVQ